MNRLISALALLILVISCSSDKDSPKNAYKTPYFLPEELQQLGVQKQSINFMADADTVLVGRKGTRIVIPAGSWLNQNNEPAEGEITLELAEALTLEGMVLSGLATTSNGKPLETDGMLYINATQNGNNLRINPELPLFIEIPTKQRISGMMTYKGEEDSLGNINWVNPKPIEQFLTTTDLAVLNFLPPGFPEAVLNSLPINGNKEYSTNLADSLFYSLYVNDKLDVRELDERDFQEEYYNQSYRSEAYGTGFDKVQDVEATVDSSELVLEETCISYDPSVIKTLKTEKFQHSYIATLAFEKRLQALYNSCSTENDLLSLYINNLGNNLWIADSLIAVQLYNTKEAEVFKKFADERLTQVRADTRYTKLLRSYFGRKLDSIRQELESNFKEAQHIQNQRNKKTQQLIQNYRNLLKEREASRMSAYGFEWAETGWVNIDRPGGVREKNWGWNSVRIAVSDRELENLYTYVFYTSIKSLYRLSRDNNGDFYTGNSSNSQMLMPKKQKAVAISIGFAKQQVFYGMQEFTTGSDSLISLEIRPISKDRLDKEITKYEAYGNENSLSTDVNFMQKFSTERTTIKAVKDEQLKIYELRKVASPCCYNDNIN